MSSYTTIELQQMASWVLLEKRLPFSLGVVLIDDDGTGKKPVGVLHIHDCPAAR